MKSPKQKIFDDIVKYVAENESKFNVHNLAAELSLQVMEKGEYHYVNDGEGMIKNDIVRYCSKHNERYYFRIQERLTKGGSAWGKLTTMVCEVEPYLESKVSYTQISPERCL